MLFNSPVCVLSVYFVKFGYNDLDVVESEVLIDALTFFLKAEVLDR